MIRRGGRFGSAGDQCAQTPDCVWEWLDKTYGIGRANDICPPNHQYDALAPDANWYEICEGSRAIYCNPPYNNIDKWIEKAEQQLLIGYDNIRKWMKRERDGELEPGINSVIFLIPTRTCTKGFHKHVLNGKFTTNIFFIEGRLTFKGYTKPNPTPMCIVELDRKKFIENQFIKDIAPMMTDEEEHVGIKSIKF